MTNRRALTRLPDPPQPDVPAAERPARGFLDCRGEWQDLDDQEDRDVAP